ncbi:glycosyltransferase [Demequina sp. SYSU T00192]|uniref:Glycosyltransferase n=1 Tax=Demequina litoralis TaxID=3051660 RepID=A0ABT8G8H0_9MICO|nr:glycosyltransferase [Demequina sp. SYSU T00192]MDN4475426.1 glycosyltransferase [Demequina sp. SYSU T00192]
MKITFLSNVPLGSTFRLGSHHLSRELARSGHDVVHLSTPLSLVERALNREVMGRNLARATAPLGDAHRRLLDGGYRDDAGVWHDVPRPIAPIRLMRRSRSVQLWLRQGHGRGTDVAIIDQLFLAEALVGFRGTVIYRSTDMQTSPRGARLEQQVLSRADGVVWCSPVIAPDAHAGATGKPQLVLENGVDDSFFGNNAVARRTGFVYVGALDRRFDWHLVIALARRHPNTPFGLAGPVTSPPRERLPGNITLLGPVPYDDVPRLLQSYSIGLLPLTDDPMNAARSPMKYFEYLASGLQVLASQTPGLAARPHVQGVRLYDGHAGAFAGAEELLSLASPNLTGQVHARMYRWQRRARELEQFVESVVSGTARRGEDANPEPKD